MICLEKKPEFPYRARLYWLLLLVLLGLSLACRTAGSPVTQGLSPGDHTFTLDSEDLSRSYIVHVPPQVALGELLPVVLNFHGGGGNAQGHKDYVHMDDLADEAGFLVVYPNGTGPFEGRLLTWNAGSCCGFARENQIDDVEFVRTVLDDLATRIPIDEERVYATGLSNGAMMAYRLAVEAPDRIRAIAPVAGAMVLEGITPPQPVPVMHFHSVDDPRALYEGGLGPPFPFTNNQVLHNPVDDVIATWVAANGCLPEPSMGEVMVGDPGSQNEGQTATRINHGGCATGANVVLWKMTVAGHVWPGGTPDYLARILGPSTDLIDANREMWIFFSQFP